MAVGEVENTEGRRSLDDMIDMAVTAEPEPELVDIDTSGVEALAEPIGNPHDDPDFLVQVEAARAMAQALNPNPVAAAEAVADGEQLTLPGVTVSKAGPHASSPVVWSLEWSLEQARREYHEAQRKLVDAQGAYIAAQGAYIAALEEALG